MYTDTDSLIYYIKCDNDIMKRDINRFDTSDYAVDNAYCFSFSANKKVPGLMKHENSGTVMSEFGFRAKIYALRRWEEGHEESKKNQK